MLERNFQQNVISKLKEIFPDGYILKNDSSYKQGIPDLILLVKDKWAMLECKKDKKASKRPNQEYYVDKLNKMSYSRFIYPENFEDVIAELKEFMKK